MLKSLLITILAGTLFNPSEIVLALPGSTQTVIYPTIKRSTIIHPVQRPSSTKFSLRTSQSSSHHRCFQIDADSKMYIRDQQGGNVYYPPNNPSSYTRTMTKHQRCN
jgi:hypothetical protein